MNLSKSKSWSVGLWLLSAWVIVCSAIVFASSFSLWIGRISTLAIYCTTWLNDHTRHMTWLGSGLIVLLFLLNGQILLSIVQQRVRAARLMKNLKWSNPPSSIQLWAREHGMEHTLLFTSDKRLISFTVGFLNPHIVLSQGMVDALEEKQWEAVLLHEHLHALAHHPLYLSIARAIAKAFWFLPIIGEIAGYYHTQMELAADRYVIQRIGKQSLASAFLIVMEKTVSKGPLHYAAWSGFNDCMRARIHQLNEGAKKDVPFVWTMRAIAQSSISGILYVGILAAACR